MAIDTMTSVANLLKKVYDKEMRSAVFGDSMRPFMKKLKKASDDGGASFEMTFQYGDETGASGTPATAIANPGAWQSIRMSVTQATHFFVGQLDGRLIENAKEKGEKAFGDAVKTSIRSSLNQFANITETAIFRRGNGVLGKIGGSTTASTTVALDDPLDHVNFYVGQRLSVIATDAMGSTIRDAGDFVTVTAVQRGLVSSTLTVDNALATQVAGAVVGDWFIGHGDQDVLIRGLPAWNPAVAPTAGDSFFGADRSPDPEKLAGSRIDVSDLGVYDGLYKALHYASTNGAAPDTVFINPMQFYALTQGAASKQIFTKKDLELGFETAMIFGPNGPVEVVPSPKSPSTRANFVKMDSWKLRSTPSGWGFLKDKDTTPLLRLASSDTYEYRVAGYGMLVCEEPWNNVVATLPSAQ